jgi:carbamoyl-phosphate synthase small subunit
MNYQPDGVLLSNGPGDPYATINYSITLIKEIIKNTIPIFGICLGHQILALALGGKTMKMSFGHHGANHPVLDLNSRKVFITSMNHGFTVDIRTLPSDVIETHKSLFDGSNCGIEVSNKPIFSVQFHPEASPGPQDCYHVFEKFIKNINSNSRKLNNAKKN